MIDGKLKRSDFSVAEPNPQRLRLGRFVSALLARNDELRNSVVQNTLGQRKFVMALLSDSAGEIFDQLSSYTDDEFPLTVCAGSSAGHSVVFMTISEEHALPHEKVVDVNGVATMGVLIARLAEEPDAVFVRTASAKIDDDLTGRNALAHYDLQLL